MKTESSDLFISLVNKHPMFPNPNLMNEWLDFGILSIFLEYLKTQNKRSTTSTDNNTI